MSIPDRRNAKGNNPEIEACVANSGKTKDTSMVDASWEVRNDREEREPVTEAPTDTVGSGCF